MVKTGGGSFRPLSWGLSFNTKVGENDGVTYYRVFVPFLGDFLSMALVTLCFV